MSQTIEQSDLFEDFIAEKGYTKKLGFWVNDVNLIYPDELKREFDSWLEDRTAKAENSRYSEKDEPEYWEDR